ncbi:MAG: YggS family pyridoxal phosphate enzyme, partial [Dethiobacteria bacterium]
RPIFRQVRELKEKIGIPGIELKYLSMGMTNDFHIAVEEGANMVRIGTALFGAR